jgi:hypothetical protein
MTLRPKFLTLNGHHLRFRWWLCVAIHRRVFPLADALVYGGKAVVIRLWAPGMTDPTFRHGRRLMQVGRRLDWLCDWLMRKAGPKFTTGGRPARS